MPSILLPLMTGLFLVFAGILIGYFLWFRDRTEEETLQQDLSNENNRLESELSAMQQRTTELEEYSSKQNGKLQILQELCDDLVSGREETHQQRMEMGNELRVSRQLLDESREKLNEEHTRRAELEDQLHELKQRHLESVSALEGDWREKHSKIESVLSHRENEVLQLTSINDRTAERLHEAESRIAALASEISSQRSLLETATTNANGLEMEYVSLESSLREQNEMLNESRGQTAAALSAKQLAEESLGDAQKQIETQNQKLEKLEQIAVQADKTDQKCASLQQSLVNHQQRLVEITTERDAVMSAEKDALATIAGLRKQIENQETTIRNLQAQRESVDKNLKEQVTAHTMLENEFIQQRHQWSLKEEERTIRTAQLKDAFEQTQNELVNKASALEQAHHELATTTVELANRERDLRQTEEQLIELERRFNELESRSAMFKSRVVHLIQQRDNAMIDKRQLADELNRVRRHSKANEDTIRILRRERGAILLRSREARAEHRIISGVFHTGDRDPSTAIGPRDEISRRDPVRGIVYTQQPDVTDDLKLISGIADVLERRLNECGIYTYWQIMQWDQTAINEFSNLITFKDRIERDDWVGQARRLYEWRYRRAA